MEGLMCDTPDSVSKYQAIVIKKALELWHFKGLKVNRMYTPKNMMRTASFIVKKEFKPRDYPAAINALKEFIES